MGDVLAQGLLVGGVYALIALGFILVFKSSGVLNLAHGQVIAILSYLLYQIVAVWGLPSWAGIVLVILFGAVMAVLIERLAVRPLLGQPFLSVMMMTLMLAMLLKGVMLIVWGADSFTLPFTPRGQWTIGSETSIHVNVIPGAAISFAAAMVIFLLLMLLFRYTKVGLSMR